MTDGDHRRASDFTQQPCPWPDGTKVEWFNPENNTTTVATVIAGSPVGLEAWKRDGHVLCSITRTDGQEAVFLATATAVRDALKAMEARRME